MYSTNQAISWRAFFLGIQLESLGTHRVSGLGDEYVREDKKRKGRRKEATRRGRMEATVCHFLLSSPDPALQFAVRDKELRRKESMEWITTRHSTSRAICTPLHAISPRARHATPSAPLLTSPLPPITSQKPSAATATPRRPQIFLAFPSSSSHHHHSQENTRT
jgi:hypothetical protein